MRHNISILFLPIILLLTSCVATANRETRLIERDRAEDWYFVQSDMQISCRPIVLLTSSCSSDNLASFGPVFIWELPVIPNPFWPFQYWILSQQQASFKLTVTAPPGTSKWENVNIKLLLNEKTLTSKQFEERSDISKDERQYSYEPEITCGELEGSKIDVHITGFPETIEAKLQYAHQWHVHAYIGPYWGMWNHARETKLQKDCRLRDAEDHQYESARRSGRAERNPTD